MVKTNIASVLTWYANTFISEPLNFGWSSLQADILKKEKIQHKKHQQILLKVDTSLG